MDYGDEMFLRKQSNEFKSIYLLKELSVNSEDSNKNYFLNLKTTYEKIKLLQPPAILQKRLS